MAEDERTTDVATPEVPEAAPETGETAMEHAIERRSDAAVPEDGGHDFAQHAVNPEDVEMPRLRTKAETEANAERFGHPDFAQAAENPPDTHTRAGAGETHDFAQHAINPEDTITRRRG